MVINKYLILFMVINPIMVRCQQRFSFSPTDIISINLKTQGYYYTIDTAIKKSYYMGTEARKSGFMVSIYFLYLNGRYNYTGTLFCEDTLRGIDRLLSDAKKINHSFIQHRTLNRVEKSSWGIFKLDESTIIMEIPRAGEGFIIEKKRGGIINDSTIFVENIYKDRVLKKEVWHYKACGFKPDSSVVYNIKTLFPS